LDDEKRNVLKEKYNLKWSEKSFVYRHCRNVCRFRRYIYAWQIQVEKT